MFLLMLGENRARLPDQGCHLVGVELTKPQQSTIASMFRALELVMNSGLLKRQSLAPGPQLGTYKALGLRALVMSLHA
jgi:hypothetical protein